MKILVAVDGSEGALRAVDQVVREARTLRDPVEVHVLNVQPPMEGPNVKMFIARKSLDEHYREEGQAALRPAQERLKAAGLAAVPHIGVGDPGEVIRDYAKDKGCERIVMGTRGLGPVSGMVMGSVANKVVHLSPVPVLLVK